MRFIINIIFFLVVVIETSSFLCYFQKILSVFDYDFYFYLSLVVDKTGAFTLKISPDYYLLI